MERINVWVKAPCDARVRALLEARCGAVCRFRFARGADFPECGTEVILGEPDRAEILAARNLRWIQLTWAGADQYAQNRDVLENITVTNASGAFGTVIAEYVLGALVCLYRRFPQYWQSQRQHRWAPLGAAGTIFGKRALVLGTGDLGRNVARRLRAFGASVDGVRRSETGAPVEGFDRVLGLSQLDALLPQADIVVGCLPGTAQTAGLLSRARLRSMKPDAVLVNVGRGSLVDTDDLVQVLKSGHLRGAALDVLSEEPLPEDSALWDLENVLLTPHIAGPSFGENRDVQDAIWAICLQNLARYTKGQPLTNVVDLAKGY